MGRNTIAWPAAKTRQDMRRKLQSVDTGSGHAVTMGDILSLERFQARPNGTIWLIIRWSAFRNRVNDQSEPKVRVANLT